MRTATLTRCARRAADLAVIVDGVAFAESMAAAAADPVMAAAWRRAAGHVALAEHNAKIIAKATAAGDVRPVRVALCCMVNIVWLLGGGRSA